MFLKTIFKITMDWKYEFQKHILERGYYYTHNVKNLKKENNLVEATVSGTRDYKVKINLDDYSMSCTCPYFERDNCKHLAAVLYCLEEEKHENISADYESSDDIDELFESVDIADRLDFLLDLLYEDKELSNCFRQKFSKTIDRDYYTEKLSDILFEDDFEYELSNFIDEDMELLYDLKEYDLLMNLLKSSTEAVLDEMRFDDYYFGSYFHTFEGIFTKLIKTPARSKLFEMINWQLYFYRDVYGLDDLIDFYNISFTSKEELEEKLDVIDEILDESNAYKTKLVLLRIDTMKSLSKGLYEINEFRGKYSGLKEIKQQYIDEAVEDEDYELAIRLVKKELKKELPFILKKDYNNQLKELYLKVNDKSNYKRQLEEVLFNGFPDISDYVEYAKLSDNWLVEREEFYNKIDDHHFLNECYNKEGLYDRLVLNLRDEYDLRDYKNVLRDKYPDELLEAYLNVVNQLVLKSGTRKHYRNIVGLLKEMKSIEGGDDMADDLISNWKIRYKRRTAMIEELEVL